VEEEPHHNFGADLIGQVYELDLRSGRGMAAINAAARARG
jgi:hypothetical protein